MTKRFLRKTVINRSRCASAVAAVVAMLAAQGALAQQAAPATLAPATQTTPPAPQANGATTTSDSQAAPAVVCVAGTRRSVACVIDRKLPASFGRDAATS